MTGPLIPVLYAVFPVDELTPLQVAEQTLQVVQQFSAREDITITPADLVVTDRVDHGMRYLQVQVKINLFPTEAPRS